MGWSIFLLDILLAFGFLFIATLYGYLEQKSLSVGGMILSWNINDNLVAATLLPALLVLFSGVLIVNLDKLHFLNGLWLVGLYIFIIKSATLIITKRIQSIKLLNWIISGLITVAICYIFSELINYSKLNLKLSPSNSASIIWCIGTIAIIYLLVRILPTQIRDLNTNRRHIGTLYVKYFNQFKYELKTNFKKDELLQRIFFAILITEDLNRPSIFRFFERLVFPLGFIKTTGIMQVTNKNILSDSKSIVLAQDLIAKYYKEISKKNKTEYNRLKEIAYLYNDGDFYTELILYCYFTLTEIGAFNGEITNI